MKQLMNFWLMYLCAVANAQNNTSEVRWIEGLDWNQIKDKAKKENKPVFVDCYATWCGPCKAMDKNVYTDSNVSEELNERFVSVRIQMDQTNLDNENVKKWYNDANNIRNHYSVKVFPTYLFFSSTGVPLHKDVGYKDPKQFISLIKNALIPNKQYYRLLQDFQPGKMDTSEMKGLALGFINSDNELAGKIAADYLNRIPRQELKHQDNLMFMKQFPESNVVQEIVVKYLNSISDQSFSDENNIKLITSFKNSLQIQSLVVARLKNLKVQGLCFQQYIELFRTFKEHPEVREYAHQYINHLPKKSFFNWEHVQLLTDYTNSSNDRGFFIFYKSGKRIDAIVKNHDFGKNISIAPNYSEVIVANIISKEEIDPYWKIAVQEEKIDWEQIHKKVRKKYSEEYADIVILNAKIRLYEYFTRRFNKYWSEYIEHNIRRIDKYGTDTSNSFIDLAILNNFAWDAVFIHSNDKNQLNSTINFMEGVVRRHPRDAGCRDTYANLLYKVGRIQEAISNEKVAIRIATDEKDEYRIKSYSEVLNKMNSSQPTWPLQN